jgi:hypothetical protein
MAGGRVLYIYLYCSGPKENGVLHAGALIVCFTGGRDAGQKPGVRLKA